MTYDSSGNLLSSSDPLGKTRRFEYDAGGNATTLVDSLGNTSHKIYDSNNRLISSVDPLGNSTSYAYDLKGNTIQIVDAVGAVTRANYDDRGSLVSIVDPLGFSTAYSYTDSGFLDGLTLPNGNISTMAVDKLGNVTSDTVSIHTATGSVVAHWAYQYNANGDLVKIVAPDGAVSSLGYDATGQLINSKDAMGNTTALQWSADGQQSGASWSGLGTVSLSFDAAGRNIASKLPGDRSVQYTYDDAGQKTSTTLPDGTKIANVYDADGRVVSTNNGPYSGGSREYDAAGRIIRIVSPDGAATRYEYDAAGRLIAEIDALDQRAEYVYDKAGRIVSSKIPSGQLLSRTYDLAGNLTSKTDLNGGLWKYEWSPSGLPLSVTDPVGQKFTFQPNGHGTIDRVIDPLGRVSQYTYDLLGHLVAFRSPVGTTYSTIYDELGRVQQTTDGAGRTISNTYTADGRISSRNAGPNEIESYGYDSSNQLVQVQSPQGTMTIVRDVMGRLSKVTGINEFPVTYQRDELGRSTAVSTSAGNTLRTLSDGGRLVATMDPSGGITSTTYDALGRAIRVEFANGSSDERTYDALGRTTNIIYKSSTGTVLRSWNYTRNDSGQILAIDDSNGQRTEYLFDGLGRLHRERVVTGGVMSDTTYSYDAVGNVTQVTDSHDARAFTVDANDQLQDDGRWSYSWNGAGLMVSRTNGMQTEHFEYDSQNRLIRFVRTGPNATTVAYSYDFGGLLARRSEGGTIINYVWDQSSALPQLLEERDGQGSLIRRYESDGANITRYRDGAGNAFILIQDHLGSIKQVVDNAGNMVANLTYSAFGQSTGSNPSSIGYTNGLTDSVTGMVFLRTRWYMPDAARYITPDSAPSNPTNSQSNWNRYSYVGNDPINRYDPTGQSLLADFVVANKIFLGLVATFITFGGTSLVQSGGLSALGSFYPALTGWWPNGTTTSFNFSAGTGIGKGGFSIGASFGGGFELVNNYSSYERALFLYFGPSLSVGDSKGVGPSGSFSLGNSLLFDTPNANSYSGWFWSVTASKGYISNQIEWAVREVPYAGGFAKQDYRIDKVSSGSGSLTFAWSPGPTFYAPAAEFGVPSVVSNKSQVGYRARHSHTLGAAGSLQYSTGISLSVTYYVQLLVIDTSYEKEWLRLTD